MELTARADSCENSNSLCAVLETFAPGSLPRSYASVDWSCFCASTGLLFLGPIYIFVLMSRLPMAIGLDAIVVNEYPLRLDHCPRTLRGSYFGVSPAGGFVWVFDARPYQVSTRIPVGPLPYELDFSSDGTRLYTTTSGNDTLLVIDVRSRVVLAPPLSAYLAT